MSKKSRAKRKQRRNRERNAAVQAPQACETAKPAASSVARIEVIEAPAAIASVEAPAAAAIIEAPAAISTVEAPAPQHEESLFSSLELDFFRRGDEISKSLPLPAELWDDDAGWGAEITITGLKPGMA